jgi:hypothetical protein
LLLVRKMAYAKDVKLDVRILVAPEGVAGLLRLRDQWCFWFPAIEMSLETAVYQDKRAASLENGVLVRTRNWPAHLQDFGSSTETAKGDILGSDLEVACPSE